MHVTVVIPAFNEERRIVDCLEAFCRQRTPHSFDLIIVDNNSTDRTADIAASFSDRLNLEVVFEEKNRRGAARKAGFAQAKGDIILSTDADSIVPPHWISRLVYAITADSKTVGAVGWTRVADCSVLINVCSTLYFSVCPYVLRLWHRHHYFDGKNFAIRRSAYEQCGGFNPDLDAYEDIELSNRVAQLGRIRFVRRAVIESSGRRFQKGFLRGLWDYFSMYIRQFWLRKQNVTMTNLD